MFIYSQSYTKFTEKQAPKLKKCASIAVVSSHNFSLNPHFDGNSVLYRFKCTKLQRSILQIFLDFRFASHIKITNKFIAEKVSCSLKTVTRATNKFQQDGVILKNQRNRYAPNQYTLHNKLIKGTHAYNYWLNNLTAPNQDLYLNHGFYVKKDGTRKYAWNQEFNQNVPHNNNYIKLSCLYNNQELLPRARARKLTLKMNLLSFSKIEIKKREGVGVLFSEKEMEEIAKYPKEVVEYASKKMTTALHTNQIIKYPFKWFVAVCEIHLAKQRQPKKVPYRGSAQPFIRPKDGPLSIFKPVERKLETDYDFCLNVERILHRRLTDDQNFNKDAARFANPRWDDITVEQREKISAEVHIDCSCRKTVDKVLDISKKEIHDEIRPPWKADPPGTPSFW